MIVIITQMTIIAKNIEAITSHIQKIAQHCLRHILEC